MPVTESGIVIPHGIAGVKLRKAFRCNICGEQFPHNHRASYEGHVSKCAREHMDELRALSPKRRHPGILGDGGVDVELRRRLQSQPGGRDNGGRPR